MIFLILAIGCSSAIPLLFRLGKHLEVKEANVIAINYLMISIVLGIQLFTSSVTNTWSFQNLAIRQSLAIAILLGCITGVLFYGGFYFYQKSVRIAGPSLASGFGKMGILIPMVLSILIWREVPTPIQWGGIVIALCAMVIIQFDAKQFKKDTVQPVLLLFFLIGGLGDFANKIFQKYCLEQHTTLFLFVVFLVALLLSFKGVIGKTIHREDLIIGISLGVPNVLNSIFLLKALGMLPALIVFPMFSGGTIVVTTLLSVVLFKEKLKSREYMGIGLMVIAVGLVSM